MANLFYPIAKQTYVTHIILAHSWNKIEGNIELLRVELKIMIFYQMLIHYADGLRHI